MSWLLNFQVSSEVREPDSSSSFISFEFFFSLFFKAFFKSRIHIYHKIEKKVHFSNVYKYLFMCFFIIHISFLAKYLFKLFDYFYWIVPLLLLLFKLIYLIYFWLCWVFVAVHGLSLVVASRDYSSLQCVGSSLRWLLLLWSTGSRRAGSVVVVYGF